jgi:hypothetical protein
MKRLLALASAAAVTVAVSVPAVAQSGYYYDQPYQQQRWQQRQSNDWDNGWNRGWNNRAVSDPSFGNRTGLNNARRTGRCVADLGYGRFEYCGW